MLISVVHLGGGLPIAKLAGWIDWAWRWVLMLLWLILVPAALMIVWRWVKKGRAD